MLKHTFVATFTIIRFWKKDQLYNQLFYKLIIKNMLGSWYLKKKSKINIIHNINKKIRIYLIYSA